MNAELRQIVDKAALADEFSGVVGVYQHDKALLTGAWGLASRVWRIPNRYDTRFRVASIGKMFTALAVLRQIERGRLPLEDRVQTLLGLGQLPPDISVRHLLTMTAGIADWLEESEGSEAAFAALAERVPLCTLRENKDYLPLFLGQPPRSPVGAQHAYNNASYILLGLVIERVTGEPYAEHMRDTVFGPLGLSATDLLSPEDAAEGVAEGYLRAADGRWKRNISLLTPPAADGGLTSSAADLISYLRALREGRALSPEGTAALLRPQVIDPDPPHRGYQWWYGYGLIFLVDAAGEVVRYGHTGEEEGASCRLWHYPRQGVDLVMLGNQSGCAGDLSWALHDAIVRE